MSTVLRFTRTSECFIVANEKGTVTFSLPLEHPVGKLFTEGKETLFAKCKVTAKKVTVINHCKPWKE